MVDEEAMVDELVYRKLKNKKDKSSIEGIWKDSRFLRSASGRVESDMIGCICRITLHCIALHYRTPFPPKPYM